VFHGRFGHAPGGTDTDDVSYVRPHELEIVAKAGDDTWPVTLSQTLTVGPNTRIEFLRDGGHGYVDVELPKEAFGRLRESLTLEPGARVHLRPRRVTRFVSGGEPVLADDPAALI
jgi:sulfate transport system ATP-binding protein